ncbi:MAG: hypothetical protein JW956_14195 [Calditrichaceae bacterium]|nr:hypothetical protein [Calditrichaceae bacterium]HES59479.1 hypothetical protein [Caldithrix sp.]
MSKSYNINGALTVILILLLSGTIFAERRKIDWKAFSTNLIVAIHSEHPGLQESAMQRIIQYADSLEITDAVYDIALIFRFDGNSQMRRLAMVTLSKINTDHSLNYLCRYLKYEDNPSIRKQCCCIIRDYYVSKKPDKMDELAVLLTERASN